MKLLITAALLSVTAAAVGCGGGSTTPQNSAAAQIRVMQGSPDLGNVDVFANGQVLATDLGYHVFPTSTTKYMSIGAGNIHFQEFPTGTTSTALVDKRLDLSADTFYTVLTVGEQSVGSLAILTLTDDHTPPPSGQLKLRIVHGASTIGAVDVYLAANMNDVVPATPAVRALAYKAASSYITFPGSTVTLCINPTGVVPASMNGCLLSMRYLPLSQPETGMTMLFLDQDKNIGGGNGNFALPFVVAAIPY